MGIYVVECVYLWIRILVFYLRILTVIDFITGYVSTGDSSVVHVARENLMIVTRYNSGTYTR